MIAIKDMAMPRGCNECRGLCQETFPFRCHIADRDLAENESCVKIDDANFKPSWCPLIQVSEVVK